MNLFGASSIILFFASLGFGLFVYSKNRTSLLNRLWFLFSASVAVWGLALYGVTSTSDVQTAFYWQYLLDVMGIFIPVLYFFFVSNLLGLQNDTPRAVVGWLGVLLIAFSFTNWFKTGLQDHLGFFWIEPGEWYFLFPLFFAGLVLYSIYLLAHQYHQTIGTQLKQQIKYQLLGALIGFGGGLTNFLPQLFDIFPFGNYVITLYVLFIGYSVISNRLFNLKTVAIELFVGGASLVFLINLLVSETPRDWFMRFVFFLLTLFFSFLIIRFVHRIEKLAEELEDANKQQGSLIHLISHEVKNGLGKANDVFAEIVEGSFDADVSGLKEFTRAALHDNRKVVEQVEDVLRSADFKTGKISYDKKLFDFREALQESTEKYKAEAEAKGLAFRVCIAEEQNYTVNGDRALIIGHLFKNLLENAINFTPQGSITVSLSARYGKVMLVVTDTGIGITPDDMKRLFTEGGHGKDSIKTNVHSTGYGLFIAKQIVEAHGGRIWAESPASVHDYGEAKAGAGKGASFFVELPVVQLDSN